MLSMLSSNLSNSPRTIIKLLLLVHRRFSHRMTREVEQDQKIEDRFFVATAKLRDHFICRLFIHLSHFAFAGTTPVLWNSGLLHQILLLPRASVFHKHIFIIIYSHISG